MTAADSPLEAQLEPIRERLSGTAHILSRIVDDVILPALARNYSKSGIKTHTGQLLRDISQRGAPLNYVRYSGENEVTVGIDVRTQGGYPGWQGFGAYYAKWVLFGRGPVVPRFRKVLRWLGDDGHWHFAKRVGPAPPHDVYYLTEADIARAGEIAVACMEGK